MIKKLAILSIAAIAFASAAQAQSSEPQVPTPVNPYPLNPIATDGSSLLPHRDHADWLSETTGRVFSGRSIRHDD